jgi:uridine kinase
MPAPTIPFAIAIAGGSGSGKTTLTRALVSAFGEQRCALLDHDSYYRDLSHLPPEQRAGANFDHPAALENELLIAHLRALRDGEMVFKPNYDFATHTRRHDETPVEPRPLILAEGILLLSVPELADAFQLRVFVDAPPDIRALRRLQRDIVERGRTVDSVCRQYLESVRPMHEEFVEPVRADADVVVAWPQPVQSWVAQIRAELRHRAPLLRLA